MMESESILNPTRATNSPETIQSNMFLSNTLASAGGREELEEDICRHDKGCEQGEARHPRDGGLGHLAPEEGVDEEAGGGKYRYEPDIVSHLSSLNPSRG